MAQVNHSLNLTADQVKTLQEICTLVVYSDGFVYTAAMERVVKVIADQTPAIERLRTLCRNSEEERREVHGHARKVAA